MTKDTKLKCTMPHAFKLFWTHYVDFTSHSSRSAFWWWKLWDAIISLAIVIAGLAAVYSAEFTPALVILAVWCIWRIGTLIPTWALDVRRFSDTGLDFKLGASLVTARAVLNVVMMFGASLLVGDMCIAIAMLLSIVSFVLELLPTNEV